MNRKIYLYMTSIMTILLTATLFIFGCGDDGGGGSAPAKTFELAYGGSGKELGEAAAITADSGYLLFGTTDSTGQGAKDMYLVKVDDSGSIVWERTFGGADDDSGNAIAATSDGGYVLLGTTASTGQGADDILLVKVDSNGTTAWERTFGGADDDGGNAIAATSDGGYLILGSTTSLGAGGKDMYLIKTDANGTQEWEKTFGGTSDEKGNSVIQTSDGGYIALGYTESIDTGDRDMFLVKVDSEGNTAWERAFGGDDFDSGFSVIQTDDGGYMLLGTTGVCCSCDDDSGECCLLTTDMYLVKIDGNANLVWEKQYGGAGEDAGRSIAKASDGNYILLGWTESFGAGGRDMYVVKVDLDGAELWSTTFGDTGFEQGDAVIKTSDAGFIMIGTQGICGACDDGGDDCCLSTSDMYLVKTNSKGEVN